jgi:HlyD family secretion protein
MLVVPRGEVLTVEVKIPPQDIDQVHIGQKAVLRFSAFNQRTTPELDGELTRLSADVKIRRRVPIHCAAERAQATSRDACRDFHPDKPAYGSHISDQALARPDHAGV